MKGIVPACVALWVVGAAGLAWTGWSPDLATWRLVAAGVAGAAVVAGITAALTRSRPEDNVVALLSCVALAALLPASVAGLGTVVGLVLAAAAILVGYYTLQLSLRTHAVGGSVLRHGMMRITGTIAVAAIVAVLAVVGLRAGSGIVSTRWGQSLDVTSGYFLVAASVLLMAVVTALSMLAVARTQDDVGADRGSHDSPAHATE